MCLTAHPLYCFLLINKFALNMCKFVSLTVLVDFDKCNGHKNGILLF